MNSHRFHLFFALAVTLPTAAACGGRRAHDPGFTPDGGVEPHDGRTTSVDAAAPDAEVAAEAGSRPETCPPGFVLEGDVCAAWIAAGSTGCDSTATRLNDGRVLCPTSAETRIYDPILGAWSQTAALHTARTAHTATLLGDGRVLVAGGIASDQTTLASAEIYDPEDASWHDVSPMTTPRSAHAAAPLGDGRVLVVGGTHGDSPNDVAHASAELFDPTTETWTPAAPLSTPRIAPHAVPMLDGAIVVFGGGNWLPTQAGLLWQSTAEAYDPALGVWQPAPSLPNQSLLFGFSRGTAALLADGSLLGVGLPGVASSAALLDPARSEWRETAPAAPSLAEPIACPLPNGKVLVVSTDLHAVDPSRASVYDPIHDTWTPTLSPAGWYYGGTLTPLLDGSVLALSPNGAERYVLHAPSAG